MRSMMVCNAMRSVLLAFLVAALATAGEGAGVRELSYKSLAGYEPQSDVTQHSRVDLDQDEMESHLAATVPDFDKTKQIYTLGGNSGGYASVGVSALSMAAPKGTAVTQSGNPSATGYLKKSASAGVTLLTISYTSVCKAGGSSYPDISECFTVAGGSLVVGGTDIGSPFTVDQKYRNLAGFSTAAQDKMAGQEFFAAFRAYYGAGDYAHRMVMDALQGTGACIGLDVTARRELAKKGSAYMNVWMYVVREMEDAIMDCQSGCLHCNDDPVHAWDEAVAFYVGSLEGTDGSASGKLLHELADKRCANFGTCRAGSSGASRVNELVLDQFRLGQATLLEGKCVEAIPIKRRVVELMTVPLVQGALRYAYKVDRLSGGSKEKAEGAAFSMAILPLLAVCDADAAKLVSDNMRIDSAAPMSSGFAAVKLAFESTYACMGVTCEDIGGLVLSGGDYFELAQPCVEKNVAPVSGEVGSAKDQEEGAQMELVAVSIALSVLLFATCALVFFFHGQGAEVPESGEQRGSPKHGDG